MHYHYRSFRVATLTSRKDITSDNTERYMAIRDSNQGAATCLVLSLFLIFTTLAAMATIFGNKAVISNPEEAKRK